MAKYKMSSGLRVVNEQPEFETDEQAWEYLRKILNGPDNSNNVYVTLYKQQEVNVPYNNAKEYIEVHNRKYGPRPIGYGSANAILLTIDTPNIYYYWVPVLQGLTQHAYNTQL
jgi:hypothetical protein